MSLFFKIFILEYLLIALIGLIVCLLKVAIDFREKKRKREVQILKNNLKEVLVGKKAWDANEWTQKKISVPLLLRVLETLEAIIKNERWSQIKDVFCETHLFPWARAHAKSFFWSKRNLAMRIFLLQPKPAEIPIMNLLLEDKSFFIRMGAVAALAKIPSPEIISLLLARMSAEQPAARFPYRNALLNIPLESLYSLIEIYQSSTDENIRLSCLDIMSRRYVSNSLKIIKKDYQSPNFLIRFFIVKILGSLASEEAAADLAQFLKDPDPKIRAEAVLSLGKLLLEKSFEKVAEMLHDEDYEVRLQAAIALTKFGKKGIQKLETQDWDIDPQAYDAARYVLTMP